MDSSLNEYFFVFFNTLAVATFPLVIGERNRGTLVRERGTTFHQKLKNQLPQKHLRMCKEN